MKRFPDRRTAPVQILSLISLPVVLSVCILKWSRVACEKIFYSGLPLFHSHQALDARRGHHAALTRRDRPSLHRLASRRRPPTAHLPTIVIRRAIHHLAPPPTDHHALRRLSPLRARGLRRVRLFLPRYSGAHIPVSDWLFGAVPATMGKLAGYWSLALYLTSSSAGSAQRYALPPNVLDDWLWRPPADSTCSASNNGAAWLLADVCATSNGVPPSTRVPSVASLERSYAWQQMRLAARGNSNSTSAGHSRWWNAASAGGSTEAGLWFAAQQLRRVRHRSARAVVKRLLLSAKRDRKPRTMSNQLRWHHAAACDRAAHTPWRRVRAVGFARDTETAPRPCFATKHYVDSARRLLAHIKATRGISSSSAPPTILLVASDSASAVLELSDAAPEMEVRHVVTPRGEAWGGAAEGAASSVSREEAKRRFFIEERNAKGLVDKKLVVASLFADLDLLAGADAFVGTAASWISRLSLLAIAGEQGTLPPYELLDGPLGSFWTMQVKK